MLGKNSKNQPQQQSKVKKVMSSRDTLLNTIEAGTVLVGKVTTKGDIRIEGKVIGTITCDSKLVIGEKGSVEGNVDARNANIAGEVVGTVVIREILQLQKKGKIVGDIYTQKLSVEIGAEFTGNCKMGVEAKNMLQKAPEQVEDVIKRESLSMNGSNQGAKEIPLTGTNAATASRLDEKKKARV